MKRSVVPRIAFATAATYVLIAVFARRGNLPSPSPMGALASAISPWLALFVLFALGLSPAIERATESEREHARPLPWQGLGACLSSVALFVVTIRAGVLGVTNGIVTTMVGSVAIGGAFLGIATMLRARDGAEAGAVISLPVWFWMGALGLGLGFPLLGDYGLTDPWETHYAEVAREMLARDDAISPWWANEGWFHSKPVLLFWLEASSMRLFGAGFLPGGVLSSSHAHPEWAVRLPNLLAAVVGAAVLSEGVAARFGRRAGLLGGAALWMTPFSLLMARHAITDVPMLAGIEVAAGLLFLRGSAATARGPAVFRIRQSVFVLRASWPLTLGATVLVVSQLTYIASRGGVPPFSMHRDIVRAGSFGTCGLLPDHAPCEGVALFAPWLSPYVQSALFGVLAILVIQEFASTTERDTRLLCGAYLAAAFGAMAKGPLGLALPACVFAADAFARRRYADLVPSASVHVLGGLAALLAILPWYVATYARHGRLIYDDLVLRHMFGRALDHLHDVNELEDTGMRYYVAQLGYGVLPLVGLLPGAIVGAIRDTRRLSLLAWAVLCFALVTLMKTKFHHYVYPVVPPLAMLVGIESARASRRPRSAWPIVVGVLCGLFVARDLAFARGATEGPSRFIALLCYRYDRAWPKELAPSAVYLVFLALATTTAVLVGRLRGRMLAFAPALPLALYLALHYIPRVSAHFGQRPQLEAFARESASTRTPEPLLAYHLNWKGENYYTGNRVALFIHSGNAFAEYLSKRRAKGVHAFFVATEIVSIGALRGEIGPGATYERLTTEEDGNRFALLRVTFPTARP